MSNVMTVDCPSCAASFPVDPAKIPEGGCSTQCTVCDAFFDVDRPQDDLPLLEVGAPLFGNEMGVHDAGADEAVEAELLDAAADAEDAVEVDDAVDAALDALGDFEVEGDWDALATGDLTEMEIEGADEIPFGDMELDALDAPAEPLEAMEAGEPGDDDWGMDFDDAVLEPAPEAAPEPEPVAEADLEPEPVAEADLEPEPEPVSEPDLAPSPEPAPSMGFQMGRRDPHEKARRLARVLVSDMITYNPERHARALDAGTLPEDFQDEIDKSWAEYVEQVGHELAESTSYWTDALNDLLARGEPLF